MVSMIAQRSCKEVLMTRKTVLFQEDQAAAEPSRPVPRQAHQVHRPKVVHKAQTLNLLLNLTLPKLQHQVLTPNQVLPNQHHHLQHLDLKMHNLLHLQQRLVLSLSSAMIVAIYIVHQSLIHR